MTHTLILIRHAKPEIDPSKPARVWPLTESGRQDSMRLAELIKPYAPRHVISSQETKAEQTGQIIATALHVDFSTMPNLHEHERSSVGWIDDFTEFQQLVKQLFDEPDKRVFGDETANQTFKRFSTAIDRLTTTHPDQSIAVSTHGTALTLFIAGYNQMDAFAFWQTLRTPCFAVCSLPDYKFIRLVTLA